MGGQHSKIATGGTLQGAFPASIAQVSEENLPSVTNIKKYRAIVPQSVKNPSDGSIIMSCVVTGGESVKLKIPRGLKKGDQFNFTHDHGPELQKVYTSTLPTLPGMEIIQSKQIIWGSVSYSFRAGSEDQQKMGRKVAELMQDAQTKIIEQVIQQRCNACLGMAFNITNDSSGEYGNQKVVIVTGTGTPCVVVPSQRAVAIDANVIASAPLYE